MKQLKVYIAGKVSKDSSFKTEFWRDSFCASLSEKSGYEIINLDPAKYSPNFSLDEGNSRLIFGRDSFMIQHADVVVVYLSDDISVGGSQEMLIAKYFHKPLVAIAPRGGKFNLEHCEIQGRRYENYIHPFVKITSDVVVEDIDQLATWLKEIYPLGQGIKAISLIDEARNYYRRYFYHKDSVLHSFINKEQLHIAHKAVVIKDNCLLVVKYRDDEEVDVRIRGKFGFPGGKVPKNRAVKAFTQRVFEETGIRIKPGLTFAKTTFKYKRNTESHLVDAYIQQAKYLTGSLKLPKKKDEHDLERAYWIPMQSVRPEDFTPEESMVAKQVLHF